MSEIPKCPKCGQPLAVHIRPFDTTPTRSCEEVTLRLSCPDPHFCYQPEECAN